MATLEDKVEHFARYYQDVVDAASALAPEGHGSKLRKISYVAVIDALSKVIYPQRRNRARFTQVVTKFGAWEHCTRVSLPHLSALLARCPEPEFQELREFVNADFNTWEPGHLVPLDRDPEGDLVRSKWPKDQDLKTPVGTVSLESLRHTNLFYTYRNLLVHEFREHPDPLELDDEAAPIYVHMMDMTGPAEADHWVLFYPTEFFKAVSERIVDNVRDYLLQNRLDPTLHFSSGIYWLDELCS